LNGRCSALNYLWMYGLPQRAAYARSRIRHTLSPSPQWRVLLYLVQPVDSMVDCLSLRSIQNGEQSILQGVNPDIIAVT